MNKENENNLIFEKLLNNITLGDCYKVIKEIPDNSIDLVIIDPPYLFQKGGLGIFKDRHTRYMDDIEKFNEEAEDIYYKLINIHAKMEFQTIREEAINRGMGKIQNIYSYKDILETIKATMELKKYVEKEREYILNYNTPKKIKEILAAFWLTHTNDEFFNYFGFNWVPPMEIQEEAKKVINMNIEKTLNIPLLKKTDIESIIAPREILKNIEEKLTISSAIDPKTFMRGATNE